MMLQEFVLEIDESNYDEILNKELAVLQFFSDWKMNCLMSLPMLDEIAKDFCEKYPELCFGRVNVDESEVIAQKHGISALPTIVILSRGKQLDRIESSLQEHDLREKLATACAQLCMN